MASPRNGDGGANDPQTAMVTEVVARGRTVRYEGSSFSAGAEIELPKSEADRLKLSGFLVDPDKKAPTVANGPTFGTAGGPTITRG